MSDFFEVPPPEGMREEMQEHIQKAEMAAESYRHDSSRLIDELDQEQLMIFRHMLHQLVFEESGRLAAYYEGMAAAKLSSKFNVCPSCMVNHDEEVAKFDAPPSQNQLFNESNCPIPDCDIKGEHSHGHNDPQLPLNKQEMLPSFELSAEDLVNMKKYHLDDMRDADSHQILGFLCTGVSGRGSCGMVYPSIEDRMLRDADFCTGCQQKDAWG